MKLRLMLLGALFCALMAPLAAHAQQATSLFVCVPFTDPNGNKKCNYIEVTATTPLPITTRGASPSGAIATVPDASVSTGFQQVTIAASTVIVPGAASTYCNITVEGAAARYRDDGTAPTATVGMPLAIGQVVTFRLSSFAALRFIQQTTTSTLDVDCYKDA